ncbi:hypothetical protein SAMN04488589_1188 [Methanolobus vulcani]|uniref:Uncharacterized protein n=1 Tax=Methanolobus vulcani TaxID=38026 RepID=A0A7Z7AW06_9EURY|nr:hypothetical protein [Methanolobus vulcani]SDF70808.1 hypothetical protein SAMN04488589_1188 [Methanolobus vulcani]
MSINTDGPEGKNVLSDFRENEIRAFFSNFLKWELLYNNFDVQFLNVDTDKEENRGFDFLYGMYEPFLRDSFRHGVIVEVKGIRDETLFNKGRLTKDIDVLKHKIESALLSKNLHDDPKIQEKDINYFKYGILCYRFTNFDNEKCKKVLMEYQISGLKNGDMFPTIFVLTNDRISTFFHLKREYNNIEFYYPYYREHATNGYESKLSLSYLFSDIIPFKTHENNNTIKNILFFDVPSPLSFKLLENFCGRYQYHDIDRIILANSDYTKKEIYKSYLSDWEQNSKKKIEISCLENDQNIRKDLAEVFR